MSSIKATIVQFGPEYLDPPSNREWVANLLKGHEADLIVLPELFASGYFFRSQSDVDQVAEAIPDGPTVEWLQVQARVSGATWVAGLPERHGHLLYNSAVVVTPNGTCHTYRKIHLYYEEKEWFTPGDLGFRVFELESKAGVPYRLGLMICFDWYYPEAARTLALQGADIIAHPSNLVRKNCPRAMPIRALENRVFTMTANRIGTESNGKESLRFIGKSLICDPKGAVMIQAPTDAAFVGSATLTLEHARNRQLTPHNNLFADRRPQYYEL